VVSAARPSLKQIRGWLDAVADPEIPAISVTDLGIVREVAWATDGAGGGGDELVVTITPTYSGCPATEVIAADIRRALRRQGVARVRLVTRLAPAWTTDWISPRGRANLRAYGIAPPAGSAAELERALEGAPGCAGCAIVASACPRCGSDRTRVVSRYGSTPCKAHYVCEACQEPFDYFKPH
jgi:ring-1,2-phenylacetyl-CoA epoxidase subunit PaaD